ncbi:MAG: hypothetical protein AAF492_19280, partial [Verrucomicrobiota bacterium]
TDVNNPPNPALYHRFELQSVFDMAITPLAHDGSDDANPLQLVHPISPQGTNKLAPSVFAYGLDGFYHGRSQAQTNGLAGIQDPSALIEEIDADEVLGLLVVGTSPHFDIQPTNALPDTRIGRELIAIVPLPDLSLDPVPYMWQDLPGNLDASNWYHAATNHFESLTRERASKEIGPQDTLAGLLFEYAIGRFLDEVGLLPASKISFTGFRESETPVLPNVNPIPTNAVFAPRRSELTSLQLPDNPMTNAYLLMDVFTTIDDALIAEATPEIQTLNRLAMEIYRISARFANTNAGLFPSPIETLRDFICTGTLAGSASNVSYAANTTLSGPDLVDAQTAINQILALLSARPTAMIPLRVREDSFTQDCLVFDHATISNLHTLIQADGRPFQSTRAFDLEPDSLISVHGYLDRTSACSGVAVEVISLALTDVPEGESVDSNSNLLPDSWEQVFFGLIGVSAFVDSDLDTYLNLQELFEGTDPNDGDAAPQGAAVNLNPPPLEILLDGNDLEVCWAFPAAYQHLVNFELCKIEDLLNPVF